MSIRQITFHSVEIVPKGWGEERHIINNDLYCGKILCFTKGKSFSNHFHFIKEETWYVIKGKLKLTYFNLSNANKIEKELNIGDIIHIPPGNPHQLEALEDSEIFEVSTTDRSEDSYRIGKGASQR